MATEIVSLVIEIGKLIGVPIKRHASYLFCYGRNVATCHTEANRLQQRIDEVQQDVDQASQRGEVIRDEVQQWLGRANDMKCEAKRVVDSFANTKCWKGCNWNPVLYYGLGKEAAEKIISIGQLKNEGKFDSLSRPAPLPEPLPDKDFQALPSTKETMKHVMNALKDNEIHIIGLYGMGGVGKTALMKEVAKQSKREGFFDKVVMVTVSQNAIIEKIQEEIKELLGLKLDEKTEQVRATRLSARLKQVGKLLIILDDLWDTLVLSVVGIPYGDEHKGCKIVITSRSLDVCRMMRSQRNIYVNPFDEKESWTLFKTFVGDVVNSNNLFQVARDIVRECKGLPLAIKVLGLALREKNDIRVWNAMSRRLGSSIPTNIKGMEKEVFEVIKYSFDHLESEEAKLCFLFCCLSPEDTEIYLEDITWYMVGEGLLRLTETLDEAKEEVSLYMDKLKCSGLLLEGRFDGQVMMHDIVRDVAIWIAEKTYGFYSRPRVGLMEWPRNMRTEECQRLSLFENKINVLPDEPLWYPNLQTLLLADNSRLEMIPDGFFSKMKALKVVDICRTQISSFPASLLGLTNLTVLDVRGCEKLMHLSGIGALKSLEILYLNDKVGISVLPIELGELCNLRLLDLSRTKCMVPSNVISRLSRLEQLHMIHGFNKWQAQGSEDTSRAAFAELACLSRLMTLRVSIRDERCLAQDLGHGCFEKLRSFQIRCKFDAWLQTADNILTITGSVVPDWAKPLLGRADGLVLLRCTGGADWMRLYGMDDLKELAIVEWHKLINVSSSGLISSAHQLERLKVHQCDHLSHVFHYDKALEGTSHNPILLPHLKMLELSSLPQLTSLCEGDVPPHSLPSLKSLWVRECYSLKHILSPISPVVLEQLEIIHILYCQRLEKLFSSDMPGLKRLYIHGCGLVSLFSWRQVRSLRLLEDLTIANCQNMVAIIMSEEESSEEQVTKDNTNVLPQLKHLNLIDLGIASFDKEGVYKFDWPSLETIDIECCPNLKMLPLSSQGAPKLRRITGSVEWFQALEWPDATMKLRLQTIFH